ncbi:MAG: bifunctional riboflavin kinase/FAD synthetase [Desulfovibrionaceae bacterium]|nr:bifunctional riboflavin kinase/FAD synthetase [Desulfovibrionaceae bacterium]
MELIHSPSEISTQASCVSIGNFDGVHLGHQSLITRTQEISRAKNYPSIIITFWPHPRQVVSPNKPHCPIATRERRLELLAIYGIDTVLELPFTKELANLSPEEFVVEYLVALNTRYLITGYDFSLGRGRSAHTKELITLGQKWGFQVEQMPPLTIDNTIVSSTHLRSLISQGAVDLIPSLLGRPYQLLGIVVPGAARGRTLGFPTANLLPPKTILPATGVYAAYATLGTETYQALVNIGHNPTFGQNPLSIEAYLLDASGDFYDCKMNLSFIKRLRDEKKFSQVDDLIAQINLDLQKALEIFEQNKFQTK